ncbi:hypothetical protein J1N35_023489 [Gossypium stocksii]|uniref:Uncharacterized protein n=1 Tax=Gossypium stocksii TaxID=47602 RepID=A0A9D3VIQ0_9ROSI|nr:hypothetical protein J1N35_023489 [Gossypium stocksii]
MNEINKTLPQFLSMLWTTESNMKKARPKLILMVRKYKGKEKAKAKAKPKDNGKAKPNKGKGLHRNKKLAKGDVDLRVGNGARVGALVVRTHILPFPSGLGLSLEDCYFLPV